jgi:N-acetylglucosamine-6-sulfatase
LAVLTLVAVCLFGVGCGPPKRLAQTSDHPNLVLILTDDLDAGLLQDHPADYPSLRQLAAEGTTFENAFVTDPLCCPSRATTLRGQYAHNHQIVGNWAPQGGARKFRDLGHEDSTVATWLRDEGYRTALVGKYMNDYYGDRVPVGWDDWYAITGGHLSEDLNENGRVRHYDPGRHHLDDVLAERATGYVRQSPGNVAPFFMWTGTQAPHAPATPAPRHKDALKDVELPRPPSFDEEDVSDKPDWVRDNRPLGQNQIAPMQDLYRKRLQSMLAVDDMVGDLVDALRRSGELDDTYIFFTSDNGWHAGEHRLTPGKWTAYEEDIRVPLMVRGPGVPEGKKLPHTVLNNDLAPTFADLAGADPPKFVDGRSLAPLLDGTPTPEEDWRRRFLVEAVAERDSVPRPPFVNESQVRPLLTGDPLPGDWRKSSSGRAESSEEWGRPWLKALRTQNYLFVEYKTSEHELYDLREDPYQLENIYERAPEDLLRRLNSQLDALRQCEAEACRAAEADG